jgi:polar amino acid transport system substrate-binding protein
MLRPFLITGLITSFLAGCGPSSTSDSNADHESAAFRRMHETGILRCGYVTYPTLFAKDEKTGAVSGMMVDFMEEIGRLANVKIVWDHEVDWGLLKEEFAAQKMDAFCAGDWIQPHKIRQVYYSNPFAYDTTVAVVRTDDDRFNGNMEKANSANATICIIDGDASDSLTQTYFPHAKRYAAQPLSGEQGCLLNVQTGKADIALVSYVSSGDYLRTNPGKLKLVPGVKPIGIYPVGIDVAHGDSDMVQLINAAILDMQANGFLDRLMEKYYRMYPATYRNLRELK